MLRGAGPAAFAGFAALLTGIGLARFAYTPLIPVIIEAGWYTEGEAAYLGAANFAGYFLGALAGGQVRTRHVAITRAAMLVTAISLLACAEPVSFTWFAFWRLTSGVTGGMLMILAPTIVLAATPARRRGLVGGILFAGVASGIVASGSLIPFLLTFDLPVTWIALGLLALALTLLAWWCWPVPNAQDRLPDTPSTGRASPALLGLFAAYGLIAFALVPHMAFLVDWVARGLDRGIATGAACWVVVGISGLVGPGLFGALADRIGPRLAFRTGMVVVLLGDVLVVLSDSLAAIVVSSVLIGAMIPAVAVLTLNRVGDLVEETRPARLRAWSQATGAFAAAQAAAAYGYSYLFAAGSGYGLLFTLGLCAAAAALLSEAVTGSRLRPPAG